MCDIWSIHRNLVTIRRSPNMAPDPIKSKEFMHGTRSLHVLPSGFPIILPEKHFENPNFYIQNGRNDISTEKLLANYNQTPKNINNTPNFPAAAQNKHKELVNIKKEEDHMAGTGSCHGVGRQREPQDCQNDYSGRICEKNGEDVIKIESEPLVVPQNVTKSTPTTNSSCSLPHNVNLIPEIQITETSPETTTTSSRKRCLTRGRKMTQNGKKTPGKRCKNIGKDTKQSKNNTNKQIIMEAMILETLETENTIDWEQDQLADTNADIEDPLLVIDHSTNFANPLPDSSELHDSLDHPASSTLASINLCYINGAPKPDDDDSDDESSDSDESDSDEPPGCPFLGALDELDLPRARLRIPSISESEDSFVVFGDADDCSEDFDLVGESETEDDSDEEGTMSENDFGDDVVDGNVGSSSGSSPGIPKKRVRFAADSILCEVHPMIKWSYAYQAARRGPWEQHARDRMRFQRKVCCIEATLKPVLEAGHRRKVYEERFSTRTDGEIAGC